MKRVMLALMSLVMVMMMVSAASANADDLNETLGESFTDSLQDLNGTVHLSDKVYVEHDITIDKSIRIIGSNDSIFEGESQNSLFTVTGNAQLTLENIKFNNFTKETNGAVLDIKKSASVVIINCTFTNNVMAIRNDGNLEIYDSYFNNNSLITQNSQGGAISNDGKLYIENTIFTNSYGPRYTNGAAIYSNGELTLNGSTIANSYAGEDSKGSALFNNNKCLIVNSTIENNTVERYNFNYMHGAVYNQGNLTVIGSIFRNNTGKYVKPNTWYEGSPTIYNVGDIYLAYNAFVGNVYFKGLSVDVFNNGARHISLEDNWWECNENPIGANKINEGNEVTSWIVLDLSPEYSALTINESVLIKAGFRLNSGEEIKNNLFSGFDITLFDGEKYYCDSFVFNRTQKKGQYTITAGVCGLEKNVTVDVGKIPVYISFTADDNITFPDDFYIEFSSNVNQSITLTLGDKKYGIDMKDYRGNLTVKGLDAGRYDLSVVYEGDEDHFKAFNQTVISVGKMPVTLKLENISNIRADESMTARIILDPNVSPVTAQLYINGIFNKTIYLYDSINNLTFRNLREGSYNITLSIAKGENYFSANASAAFSVGRYDPKLNISVDDIRLGRNATAKISAYNFTGDVILTINGVNTTVFIKNSTDIAIPNLEGGKYIVSVIFEGNSLYMPSNATATFNVIRNDPEFTVEVTRDDKRVKIYISTKNCTGQVGVYVNFNKYTQNLTNGSAVFDIELDSGTNYIFAFYEGDRNFENATYNTTIIIDEDFILVGGDVEGFEYNNVIYSIVLVEKNRITMPGRNVSIAFNGQIYNVITDNDGVAGITLNLEAGTYVIKATYLNRTVTNAITIKAIDYDLKAKNIEYGQTQSAEVIFNGNVTGYVNFKVNDISQNVSVFSSKAVLNISDLKIGSYIIYATYFNDIFTSKTVKSTFEVKRATPNFIIKTEDIAPGEVETIEITFMNGITGNVTVDVANKTYPVEINASKAILNLNDLGIGVYDVSVIYGGNENFTAFTCSTSFSVRNRTSDITLSIDNSRFGEDVVINAILNQTATGKITFMVSDRTKTVDIINGKAKCIFKGLEAGTYRVDAEYSGDSNFKPSQSYGFFRVLKADSTISIITDEVELGQNIMIYAKVSENATGEVYFSMVGYYSPRAKEISDGSAFWYISPLEAGRYTIVASYSGDANYNPANTTFTLKVSQVKSILEVAINDASVNDRVKINVKLSDVEEKGISGKVNVSLNKKTYTINVANGVGSLILGKLNKGNYVFEAVYGGSDEYSTSSTGGSFIVAENLLESSLTAENITAFYKGSQILKIKLTSNGKAVSQAELKVSVNNKLYTVNTDNSGIATLSLDLNPGIYVARITFEETLSHQSSNATAQIKVLSTINATDVVKLYGSGTQYFAMFYTSQGSALSNRQVSFILDGKTYKVNTLPNGVVRLNINIKPGTYKITAINPQTKQKAVNSIRIYAKIMGNKDLTQYYGANKYFKVRIYNATTGKPVGSGVKVKFKVNKKTYTVKTNKNGYASLKITLKAGKYTITTTYNGYAVSNKVVVKPVLTAKNIVGKNVKKLKFKAKLVDKKGKALKGKTVKFKFRGKTYKAKTNKKGVATVTLKKLKIGNFRIVSTYGKSKITNTIRIKK